MTVILRKCSSCNRFKRLADFTKRNVKSWQCKACYNAYKHEWTKKHPSYYSHDYAKRKARYANFSYEEWLENRKRLNQTKRKTAAKRRLRAIEALGGKCSSCGVADHRVLEFDHIHGGGSKDRKTRNLEALHYAVIRGDHSDLQILCGNCHRIKTYYSRHPAEATLPIPQNA